jgi:1-acyl-sn-glycerol-3-phosphate acyltransferase
MPRTVTCAFCSGLQPDLICKIKSVLWAAYESVAMVIGLSSLAVICILGIPFCLGIALFPTRVRTRCGRWLVRTSCSAYLGLLQLLGMRLDCRELDRLRGQGPFIVIANHPSLLDAVVILSRLPNACCVMKAALAKSFLFGSIARTSGYIGNENPMKLVRLAQQEICQGNHLLIFPEGTRTVSEGVNAFGKTTSLIAARAAVPVQTLFIRMSSHYLGKHWPLFRRPSIPLVITVSTGDQFSISKDSSAYASGMTETLERYYRVQLQRASCKP